MTPLLKSWLLQAVICFISVNTISNSQYSDGRYLSSNSNGQTPQVFQDWGTGSKVSLRIYYESHCPYTIRFFKEQLAPTVERLASHLDVYMIPYGHAKTKYENGQYFFTCQHGDIECYGNKLHACAIDVIESSAKAALFNVCIMERTFDYNILNLLVEECGERLQIPTGPIWQCHQSERSSLLLKGHGDDTLAVRPRHVPYIILNGSSNNQDIVTQYLGYSVCRLLTPLPYECGPV